MQEWKHDFFKFPYVQKRRTVIKHTGSNCSFECPWVCVFPLCAHGSGQFLPFFTSSQALSDKISFNKLYSLLISSWDLSLARATQVHSETCPKVAPVWSSLRASGHCHAEKVNLFSMTKLNQTCGRTHDFTLLFKGTAVTFRSDCFPRWMV